MSLLCLLLGHKFENEFLKRDRGGWRVVFTKEQKEKKTETQAFFDWIPAGLRSFTERDSELSSENRYPVFMCRCDRCDKQYLIPASEFNKIMNKKTQKYVPDIFVNGQFHYLGMTGAQKTEIPVFISDKAYQCVEPEKQHELQEDFHLQKQEDGSYIGSFETEIKLGGSNFFKGDVGDKIRLRIFDPKTPFYPHEEEYKDEDICKPATNYEFLLPFPRILRDRAYFPSCDYSWAISNKKGTFEPQKTIINGEHYIDLFLPMWGDFGGDPNNEIKISLYITSAITLAQKRANEAYAYEKMREEKERDEERHKLAKAIVDEFRNS